MTSPWLSIVPSRVPATRFLRLSDDDSCSLKSIVPPSISLFRFLACDLLAIDASSGCWAGIDLRVLRKVWREWRNLSRGVERVYLGRTLGRSASIYIPAIVSILNVLFKVNIAYLEFEWARPIQVCRVSNTFKLLRCRGDFDVMWIPRMSVCLRWWLLGYTTPSIVFVFCTTTWGFHILVFRLRVGVISRQHILVLIIMALHRLCTFGGLCQHLELERTDEKKIYDSLLQVLHCVCVCVRDPLLLFSKEKERKTYEGTGLGVGVNIMVLWRL